MSESTSQFLNKFTETFGLYSFGNSIYGRLSAHILLGQTLKTCKIYSGPNYVDPRVSIFVIQPSATGKSTPWGLISKVATEAKIAVDDLDKATDAALIGSIETEEVIDPETKTKQVQYNKVEGKLATAELLHFDEGSMLMDVNAHTADTLTWFQKALNPLGSEQSKCTKKLAHGDQIEFYPTCSLLITSHPLEGVMSTILNKGFFQRVLLYPRDVPIIERQSIEYQRADKLGKRTYTETDIKSLGQALVMVRAKYQNTEVSFDDNIAPVFKQKIKAYYEVIKDAHPKIKDIMATFIPRYNNYMSILAFHKMCDRNGEKVSIEDINYAFSVLYLLFKDLMAWIEENSDFYKLSGKETVYLRKAEILFSKFIPSTSDGWVLKSEFIVKCSQDWKVSKVSVTKFLEKFKGYNKLSELEKNGIRYIKMCK
jgi:hypothetical protein